MSDKTSIEWTATVNADGSVTPGSTWNPVRGCVKVSPGCAHCYAETFAERFRGVPGHPYEQGFDLRLVPNKLNEPLTWKKPRRLLVNSMSDLFQDGVPDDYIDQVFAVMALAPQHTFQILTKRAERMREYLSYEYRWAQVEGACNNLVGPENSPALATPERRSLPNVWLGVSVENQRFADERIPLLLQTPAAVRFISAEPLLGPIDLSSPVLEADSDGYLDWVIVGGESGPKSRSFDLAWARCIVAQCKTAGVPCFVKQLGAVPYDGDQVEPTGRFRTNPETGRRQMQVVTDQIQLRSRKGGDPSEWPSDLRIREFPR